MFSFFSSLLASVLLMIGTTLAMAQDIGPFDWPSSSATQDSDPFALPLSKSVFDDSEQNSLEERVRVHLPADLFAEVRALISEYERVRYEEKSNHDAINDFAVWMAQALEAVENPELQKWALARLRIKPSLGKHPRLQAALIQLNEQSSTPLAKLATEILSQFHSEFRDAATRPATNEARWPIYSASGGSREQELL